MPYVRQALSDRESTIFDLGQPTSTKCVYLCNSGTRIYWDNTPNSVCAAFHGTEPGAEPAPGGRKWTVPTFEGHIDLVLAWNYFDYLTLDEIRGLFDALNKYFVAGSRVYFLIDHSAEISESVPAFELEPDDVLLYSTGSRTRAAPRYPPKQLEQLMPGFEIEKLYLMSNGLQEHLFHKII